MSKPNEAGYPRVQGRCPSCGAPSLFLGSGGFVTCAVLGCKDPCAPGDLLANADLFGRITEEARRLTVALRDRGPKEIVHLATSPTSGA